MTLATSLLPTSTLSLFHRHVQAEHPVRAAFEDNHDPDPLYRPRRLHPCTPLFPFSPSLAL